MANTKEVFYSEYCNKCEHWEKRETEDPCFDCLEEPFNYDSHKPIYFKGKEE